MSESSSTQNIVIHTERNTEYVQVKPSKTRRPDENTVVQRAFKQANKTRYSEDKTRHGEDKTHYTPPKKKKKKI